MGVRGVSTTADVYRSFAENSVKAFNADKQSVSDFFQGHLKQNKIVLFMEGTVDAPKSELSMNVVKMLTEVQATPLVSVDVLKHPTFLGFTVSKSGSERAPHLYVNGEFYGDHTSLLKKYENGELKKALGHDVKELPIASY